MRERPWLEPRAWSSSNCSYSVTSAPRAASAQAAAQPITPAPTTATRVIGEALHDGQARRVVTLRAVELRRDPLDEQREGADRPVEASRARGRARRARTCTASRLRLGVDDDLADLRPLAPDQLLDAARLLVRVGKRDRALEAQRQVGDEALVGVEEAQVGRLAPGRRADDPLDGIAVAGDLGRGRPRPRRLLRERLEMR